ncbi:MAG: glucose/arabinose dehydrogenase [Woeseiaceae bacterium]|jgi:glucose/arabinose dehydrogenase
MYRITTFLLGLLVAFGAMADEESWPFVATPIAQFKEPWAMTFLPDGRLLVTEMEGRLIIATQDGDKSEPVTGVPEVDYRGQGGLGDVVLHPDFANNGLVYLSYAEAGENDRRGAAVARGQLTFTENSGALDNVEVIWRQQPKHLGRGHYGHRLAFSPDGYLFISSGDRQKFDPAQDMRQNVGKIVRLNEDGSVPDDNPFADQGGVTAQIWTLGHRNPLGLAFDSEGRLWNQEMGPANGDELNLVLRGRNYGYPVVSNGNHYGKGDEYVGIPIPNHDTRPEFEAPKAFWVPAISPGGLMFYSGDTFPDWKGNAFIGGLRSKALIRVEINGDEAHEAERFEMGERIREEEQGPDGAIWLLEDEDDGSGGRLLKLTPKP